MSDFSLILLSAGTSSRFETGVKKQWIRIGDIPLWLHVLNQFQASCSFSKIVVTAHKNDVSYMKNFTSTMIIEGGANRQESLSLALQHIDTPYVLVSDVARGCISQNMIDKLLGAKEHADVIVPFLPVYDTIVYQNHTIERNEVKRVQTPQLSKREILQKALLSETVYTDESSAIVANGGTRAFVEGEESAHKLTVLKDLNQLPCLKPPSKETFTGIGYDVHPFQKAKPMYLGGVAIDGLDYGFKAHSDGDVAIHALIDALLGAAGMDDIGSLFPDSDAAYKNIDSKELLRHIVDIIIQTGFCIGHVDITIIAQQPKIAPYKYEMRTVLASILNIGLHHVNIKATTTEGLGFVGRKEGVAVEAIATLTYYDWTQNL